MKHSALAFVAIAMLGGAAQAQSSRDSDRRSDRYADTPQFVEPRAGDNGQWAPRAGDPNPYATTPGAPNNWATTPGAPPASVRNDDWRGRDYHGDRRRGHDRDRDQDRPGSASRGSTVKAAPNPNSANLLPEERRFGGGDGGSPRRR